jgi:hypothetical protein
MLIPTLESCEGRSSAGLAGALLKMAAALLTYRSDSSGRENST